MRSLFFTCLLGILVSGSSLAKERIRVRIVDGRNNHNRQITTDALRATLEATGKFTVTATTAPASAALRKGLAGGYREHLHERGSNLSAGQCQLLSLSLIHI